MSLSGEAIFLSDSEISSFKKNFSGPLLKEEDKDYNEARLIWNGMINKHPALIVRCKNSKDVSLAVKFAKNYNLLTSVRGGGHNVAGNAVCDGGLMIDLSLMNNISVDTKTKVAKVEPGCTLGNADTTTQKFGMVIPSGIVTSTGVAGLTLGGGFGWLSRKWGLSCDHLISTEVVTAEGEIINVSAENNPDLFWGLKGGGGNFGIVTSFKFNLRELGPEVTGGLVLYKLVDTENVLSFYNEYISTAPREVTTVLVYRYCPPAPFVKEEFHGKPVFGIGALYAGKADKGLEVLKPIKQFGSPIGDMIIPKPFVIHQAMLDAGQPKGECYYWKSEFLKTVSQSLSEKFVEQTLNMSSKSSIIAAFQLGGAIADVGEADSAYSFRNAGYAININTQWQNHSSPDKHIDWARKTQQLTTPYSMGSGYINFASADETEQRVVATYGNNKYKKLVDLKRKFDPDNFFRLNQNIKP
ncbi:MAG: FAD-binding oxidoreductase [Brumimicrobium sp.]|nr:FAD-binding oxidoreductase [Brumimicrobium sp.]MCZ2085208.1 FAD-binding oxidoreductase [Flavobacteriales bacterium]